MSTNGFLTIGKLAKQHDVNVETIRYYQRVGLMTAPEKPANGYRRYPPEAGARLAFIKHAQKLGFSLQEVRELLQLGEGRSSDVAAVAERKRNAIASQINDLQRIHDALDKLVRECQQDNADKDSTVIDRLFADKVAA